MNRLKNKIGIVSLIFMALSMIGCQQSQPLQFGQQQTSQFNPNSYKSSQSQYNYQPPTNFNFTNSNNNSNNSSSNSNSSNTSTQQPQSCLQVTTLYQNCASLMSQYTGPNAMMCTQSFQQLASQNQSCSAMVPQLQNTFNICQGAFYALGQYLQGISQGYYEDDPEARSCYSAIIALTRPPG